MKIQQQHQQQQQQQQQQRQNNKDTGNGKTKISKSKSLYPANNIDDEWNDFLMFRGENWESATENNSNANASINNGEKNNHNNYDNYDNGNNGQELNQKQNQSPQLDSSSNTDGGNNDDDDNAGPHHPQNQNQHQHQHCKPEEIPVCSPIYISTKTKISYLKELSLNSDTDKYFTQFFFSFK